MKRSLENRKTFAIIESETGNFLERSFLFYNVIMYNPQLETFLCVVESGSFSKAADKLYVSAPAVIKQINSLERSLGLQLFERTHRGLKVTTAGKSMGV